MGCGKSLTAIAIAGARFHRGEIRRLLVIAPTSVVPVWPREFAIHADFPHEVRSLEGPTAKRKKILASWKPDDEQLQVAVINYEAVWRMDGSIDRWGPDMIILDESQRIKNPRAKQSREIHRLGKTVPYRMILTGTPVSNSPIDFFSQYKFLDTEVFGTNFYAFRNRYAVMGGFEEKEIVAYKNLGELTEKAHRIACRVTKAEALDLPETTDQMLFCELEREAGKVYRDVADESMAELEQGTVTAHNVLTRLLRLSQIAGGYVQDENGAVHAVSKAKLKLLEEVLDDLMAAGKKAVVFTRFLPEITAIQKMLAKKAIGSVTITGSTRERGALVERFQEDPACPIFLGQIQTVREGLTLTAADTAIFYSLDYSYANYSQAKSRIHRISQKKRCTYIHLITKATVDEHVIKALGDKRNLADLVVDKRNWKHFFQGGDANAIVRVRTGG
jgi:SNF2 family DNA or RNA helicase